jgi:hypothetical protein
MPDATVKTGNVFGMLRFIRQEKEAAGLATTLFVLGGFMKGTLYFLNNSFSINTIE